jgi:hypothetical protein
MEDIVKEAREALATSYEYDRNNREQAVEDLRFTAGFQWSDAAQAERKGRPMITINRSGQFLRQVSNPIRQNMPIIKVEPDRDDDDDMAEIANGLLRRIQYNSSASHVYAQAVEHMVACGIGWMRVVHDYEDDGSFDQEILIKRIFNPLSVYPDPASLEPARDDMQWCCVSEMIPLESYKKRWPKAGLDGIDSPDLDGGDLAWSTGDFVRIAEYWRRVPYDREIAQLANGQSYELTEMGRSQVEQLRASGLVVNVRTIKGYKVTMNKVSGRDILEDEYECPSKWIPIIPVIGTEIPMDEGVYRHGLIRFQREPQQLHNYFMSVAAEAIGQQPKSPYLVTPKQIGEFKALWDNANRNATPYLPYTPDPIVPGGAPQRIPPPPMPASLIQMAQMLSEDMKATTGIYDAALGARSNETSGVAIAQRQEQGSQATAHFVDNLEHSLEHLGRVLIDMIPKVYDTERDLRLRTEDDRDETITINKPLYQYGEQQVKHNDLTQMRFKSVKVILGPNYASRRQEAVQNLVQLVQALPGVGEVGADLIVKNMDFEGAEQLADRLRALLPPNVLQAENPDEMQAQAPPDPMAIAQQQMMMEQQAKQAENQNQLQFEQEKQSVQIDAKRAQYMLDLEAKNAENQMMLENRQAMLTLESQFKLAAEAAKAKGDKNAQQQTKLLSTLAQMMTAPKRVVRDENGRPVGVETIAPALSTESREQDNTALLDQLAKSSMAPKRVIYDENGRPVGVETLNQSNEE